MLLKNVRRTVGLQLAAPLDAKPNVVRASGPVDPVLAAVVVALVGFGVVMVYSASAVQAAPRLAPLPEAVSSFGAVASHSRKYSDRSTLRCDFTRSRKR